MRLIKRIIILAIAAWLGSVIYVRFRAVENIVMQSRPEASSSSYNSSSGNIGFNGGNYSSGNNFKGGIGPVGNPNVKNSPKY